jgi:hypothetical protein
MDCSGNKEKADRDYATTILTFEKAGFVISREKWDSFGSSSQRKEYLGFIIDTATLTVKVPKPKLDRIGKLLKTFLASPRHKVREVASILGKLISRAGPGKVHYGLHPLGYDWSRGGHRGVGNR